MKIEVAIKDGGTSKQKGDLLEELAKKILEIQNYSVTKELRETGVELDLYCEHNANKNKNLYVECKAYREKNIDANIIYNLIGKKTSKKYNEAWLISTSEFGKEAQGVCKEESSNKDFTFYTPDKLLEALLKSKTLLNYEIPKKEIEKQIYDIKKLGECLLLITEYGYFYLFEYKEGGGAKDVFVADASNGEIIRDNGLLKKIKITDNSYKKFSFNANNKFFFKQNLSCIADENNNIFKINEEYLKKINDTGIKLTHRNKSELTLSDIFVYQDLRDLEHSNKNAINSEKLLNTANYPKCIIFGEEVSGKTALICVLQKRFYDNNLIPIFIDAKKIKSSELEKFKLLLKRNFSKQYIQENTDLFLEEKEKLVLIIDNYEAIAIKKQEYKSAFLEMISKNFNKVLIFSDDSAEMEIMTKAVYKEKLEDFKFLKIKEYGYKLRDKMIDKWLNIGQRETISDNQLLDQKDEVSKILETIIGNKFVPTYPLYIITLLQQIEAGSTGNLGGSAYAEFYNFLIIQALGTTKIKPNELDFYHTYLSFIAYNFFIMERKELDKGEMESLHKKYSEKYHKKNFSEVYTNLLNAKVIKENNNFYTFGHNYIYYFYIAKYMSDNMEKRDESKNINKQIDSLMKRLYRTEFANIIIFLIHHSKTRAENIIDKILHEAKNIFKEINPSTLSKEELNSINELVTEEIQLVIEDKNPHEHRQKKLELQDEVKELKDKSTTEEENLPNYNEDIKELDVFGKINLSMKLMEIIGQISKNYYGSLTKKDKNLLLSEVCDLGLRNLNIFIQKFSEYRDMLKKDIKEHISKKNISSSHDIEKISRKIIFDFTELICIHFIKKTSSCISSKNLFEDIHSLSSESIAMKLIQTVTKLDFSGGLNKDMIEKLNIQFTKDRNFIPKELLRYFVVDHLYKFDVEIKKKQEICSKLNIGIETQKNIIYNKTNK